MKNSLEQVLQFEGQEIKVITDKGVELFNLANSARVLGLTRPKTNGTLIITWKGNGSVYDKLNKILNTISSGAENTVPQYIEELTNVLEELENGDDRNSIYMSRYLTSRLAMECHSDKANKYKDWLARLDLSYSKGELTVSQQDLTNLVSNTMNNILPTMIKSITEQFSPILNETRKQVEEAKEQVKSMNEKLGMRNRNTQVIGKRLINRECEFYGKRIWGSSLEHKFNKNKLFNHFKVLSLDDIPIIKFEEVCDYIDTMELTPVEIIEKYIKINRNEKSDYLKSVK